MLGLKVACLASLLSFVAAFDWEAKPYNPPAIPLAVRSPYLSAWLEQGKGAALNDKWPTFWAGQVLGWAGFVKVDGKAYNFLGAPAIKGTSFDKAKQKSSTLTATQSTFVLSAGPVDLSVNFFSPVEPKDLVKHSIPFSYMTVSVSSTDGKEHKIQVYSDISAEWATGDNAKIATWKTTTGDIVTHQVQLQEQSTFAEANDHTEYGVAYYSTSNDAGVTYQSGSDLNVRSNFLKDGKLPNTEDAKFRAVNDDWPVFGLAKDLGSIIKTSSPVVFTIGHMRDPAVQYLTANGVMQMRSHYYWSKYQSAADLISFFTNDYRRALLSAKMFDFKIEADASRTSSDYKDIVILSIRQAFAAMEITISKDGDKFNTDDVLVFMKEISSNGNTNTVDVILPAWPLFLYTNPKLGKYLLEAHYRYQATGQYPNKFAIHDLGTHYPNATAHNDGQDEHMPIEESGNMIIMALSYAQATGDLEQITRYHDLLVQWVQFLVSDSLIPAEQLSTDDFAGHLANQTNLAIKGIIGIKAMSEIEKLLGNNEKAQEYSSIATDYVSKWQTLAASSSGKHLTLAYNDNDSWGLSYNLYADRLLKLDLFPKSVYDTQSAWYKIVTQPFGIPLDTRHTYTKSDWQIWTAAIMSDTEGRDLLIGLVRKWVASGLSKAPFSDWYETKDGKQVGFQARPVAGGHLALLVL